MTATILTPSNEAILPPRPVAAAAPPHVASLDGLRAIAVGGVLAVHAGVPGADLGWLGVEVFFALSGFLITTLLVREFEANGAIHVPRFWARPALRLMPAYWLYIGAISALLAAKVGWTGREGGWTPGSYLLSLWGYFINYVPQGGIWQYQMLSLPLWSLAVEEQFYFAWPGVCRLLLALRRWPGGPAGAAWGLVAAMAVFHVLSPAGWADNTLLSRGIGIVIGCAAALTCMADGAAGLRRALGRPAVRAAAVLASVLAVAALEVLWLKGRVVKTDLHRWCVPPLALLFSAVVAMLWYGPRDRLARALGWRPLAYVGRISYGLYLYHMVAQMLVWGPLLGRIDHWPKGPKFGLRLVVFLWLSAAMAAASYRWIERPFLRVKNRVR